MPGWMEMAQLDPGLLSWVKAVQNQLWHVGANPGAQRWGRHYRAR